MKTESIRVRVTQKEKDLFFENAEIMGMTMSDYVKYCCISNPPEELLIEKLKRRTKND